MGGEASVERQGGIWAWVPVGILAAMLAGLGTLAAIAVRDPGFALERDYYQKAVDYDRQIAQRAENARLAYSLAVAVVPIDGGSARITVVVRDAREPVSGARVSLEAMRIASAARVLDAKLVERRPGEYEVGLPLGRGGLWEFRVVVDGDQGRFTSSTRVDVPEAR